MKNILIFSLIAFIGLQNCSSNSNKEFMLAKKENSIDAYKSFVKKYPDAPQTLKAKLELEKLQGNASKPSPYKFSSENSIEVIRQGEKFLDNTGYLKQVFDFYKAKYKREYFIGAEGAKIAYDIIPVEGAKQALIISHGTGESSIRYAEVAYDLLSNNVPYSIFIINHRGHGYSQRLIGDYKEWNPEWNVYNVDQKDILEYRKVYVNDFEDYVKDFAQLVSIIKDKYGYEKVTALGHSMGGGVIARYVEENPKSLEKIVLSAPMFSIIGLLGADNYDFISRSIIFLENTFSHTGYTFGGKTFNHFTTKYEPEENSINPYTTSYNRYFMKKYIIQEYPETSLGSITWGFVNASYTGVKDIRNDADKIEIPTLIFQSEYDNYVHPSGHTTVCERINQKNPNRCMLKIMKAAKHELLLERDLVRNEVMTDIINFLLQ